jgi:hypothetical protein
MLLERMGLGGLVAGHLSVRAPGLAARYLSCAKFPVKRIYVIITINLLHGTRRS